MRSRIRDRQKVWFSKIEEKKIGIDTIKTYGNPIVKTFTVSATAGTPSDISAGIIPDYDREITSYDRSFCEIAEEGMAIWVDKEPEINGDGSLKISEDEVTPTVVPDYRLSKILDTKKGHVARYGIVKVGGSGG